jgi:ABA4-like protein
VLARDLASVKINLDSGKIPAPDLVTVKIGIAAMAHDAVFQTVNTLALAGWAALLLAWRTPRWAERIVGLAVPVLLSVAYAGLVLGFWSRAEGGFDSLAQVMALFTTPEIALAGWIHYLAFDLLVGTWEVRTARTEGIAFPLVLPCLALTLLFGPAGFLAFNAMRAARATQRAVAGARP